MNRKGRKGDEPEWHLVKPFSPTRHASAPPSGGTPYNTKAK